jgi:hypothetical protein
MIAVAGCGDGRPARVPVSGQVLIDGKPLTFGFVRFFPKATRGSGGAIDGDGRFTLTCFDPNDGATIGVHQVVVSACESLSPTKTKWHTPKKYASHATSGLEKEIKGPTNNLVINLSWDGGKPFIEAEETETTDAWAGRKSK